MRSPRPRSLLLTAPLLLGWLAPLLGCLAPEASAAAGPERPSLVLLIAVDQLRPDRIGPELPGGLGRLMREGRVYTDAALEHAPTETCPGHSTMLTGRHPAGTGLVGNQFFDPGTRTPVYCVDDDPVRSEVFGQPDLGRSPRNMRVSALGDWMKQADPASRVFCVSGKDRAAIAMGGKRPDAAFWIGATGFTSSRYYLAALPDWVGTFNGEDPLRDGFLADLPETWEHDRVVTAGAARPDDFPGEADDLSRTSPHPLRSQDPRELAEQLAFSPYLDLATLEFATALVREERLGRGSAPDLLALSLSATDLIGHRYGPYSHESRDALHRLDVALGQFLAHLEDELGQGSLLVALTADHGVLPLPEWLEETGELECPVEHGRAGLRWMGFRLLWRLHWKLSPFSWPRSWMSFAGSQLALKPDLLEGRNVELAQAVALAETYLEAHPAVTEAWTREEILHGESEIARFYRNSYDPERSGDLALQLAPTCLISAYDSGTTHGTPYLYDRAIPLVFWGRGIEAERIRGRAATVDIAPTLAGRLKVVPPQPLDGRSLFD